MENQELNRYVGDYDHFQEVYAVKKAQLEAAYRKQQQEISELKDFVVPYIYFLPLSLIIRSSRISAGTKREISPP